MFVVVQERIREIGIRWLWERIAPILLQFLAEAILVVMAGALIGFPHRTWHYQTTVNAAHSAMLSGRLIYRGR